MNMNKHLLKFNGESTYVDVSGLSSPSNNNGAVTIEFWNYVKYVDRNNSTMAFAFHTNDSQKVRTSCHAPWSGSLYWDCGDWGSGDRLRIDYNDYVEKWTHIALVSTGTATDSYMAIYINGEEKAKISGVHSPSNPLTGLLIGTDPTKKYFHKGHIGKFCVWNKARSQQEIKDSMRKAITGNEDGLMSCFDFNIEGAPAHLANIVPGGLQGVLNNFNFNTFDLNRCITCGYEDNGVFHEFKDGTQTMVTSQTIKSKVLDKQVGSGVTNELLLSQNPYDYLIGGPPYKPNQLWIQIAQSRKNVVVKFTAPTAGSYNCFAEWESFGTDGLISYGIKYKKATGGGNDISTVSKNEGTSILAGKGKKFDLESGDTVSFITGSVDATKFQMIGLTIDIKPIA